MAGWASALAGSRRREVVTAGLLAFVLFSLGTSQIPILGLDEGRFSQAAREMHDRGDLIVPTFVGAGRYHKPILIYWLTIASYSVFGVNERAARMPANIAGALAVMVLAWTAHRRFGAGAGILGGLLLATTMVFHVQAKACTADMVLFLPTLVTMLAFERIVAGESHRVLALAFWLGMGVAILAKGPIAPLWVAATAMALWALGRRWAAWEIVGMTALLLMGAWTLGPGVLVVPVAVAAWDLARSETGRSVLRRLRFAWGVPLLALIIGPWIVAVEVATGGAFLAEAIGSHVISRSQTAFESHGFFPGFYLVTAPIVVFPWFGFVLNALSGRTASASSRALAEASHRFLMAWMIGPWIVLELVQTKLVHYWMPSYPAGILLVLGWALAASGREVRCSAATRYLVLVGGLAVASVPSAVAAYLGVARLWPATAAATVVLTVCTAASFFMARTRPIRSLATLTGGSVAFLGLLFGLVLPDLATDSLPARSGRRATELAAPDELVVAFKPRDDDLFFYLPVASRACDGAGCLADMWRDGTEFLGLARSADFALLQDEWRGVEQLVVDRVKGIDLNRLERDEVVLFRVVGGS
jgi:4-amino-4-deoxy-L-arabinose transferase-like glycosyltransferase